VFEKYWLWRWFGGLPGVQGLTDRVVFGPVLPHD